MEMHKQCLTFRHKIKSTLFFSQITALLIESTLNFTIVFQMQLHSDKMKQIRSNDEESMFEHSETWILVGIVLIFAVTLPGLIIWVSKRSVETLRTVKFQARWTAIYGQLKFQTQGQLLYLLLFIEERWFYTIMCYLEYMINHPAIQIILMIYFFQFTSLY